MIDSALVTVTRHISSAVVCGGNVFATGLSVCSLAELLKMLWMDFREIRGIVSYGLGKN